MYFPSRRIRSRIFFGGGKTEPTPLVPLVDEELAEIIGGELVAIVIERHSDGGLALVNYEGAASGTTIGVGAGEEHGAVGDELLLIFGYL